MRGAARPNCNMLMLSHSALDNAPTASMPAAARLRCIIKTRDLGCWRLFWPVRLADRSRAECRSAWSSPFLVPCCLRPGALAVPFRAEQRRYTSASVRWVPLVPDGLGSEGVAVAPKTVVSAVAHDGARALHLVPYALVPRAVILCAGAARFLSLSEARLIVTSWGTHCTKRAWARHQSFITLFRCAGLCFFQQSSKTPAVVRGTRKRKGADHDGVGGIAPGKQKKASARARNCEHGKSKAYRKVPFVPLCLDKLCLDSSCLPAMCLIWHPCVEKTSGLRRLCIL
jgi:hypothetical protein